jgi:hypothetical protein
MATLGLPVSGSSSHSQLTGTLDQQQQQQQYMQQQLLQHNFGAAERANESGETFVTRPCFFFIFFYYNLIIIFELIFYISSSLAVALCICAALPGSRSIIVCWTRFSACVSSKVVALRRFSSGPPRKSSPWSER